MAISKNKPLGLRPMDEKTSDICKCGGSVVWRYSMRGWRFLTCTGWPVCKKFNSKKFRGVKIRR